MNNDLQERDQNGLEAESKKLDTGLRNNANTDPNIQTMSDRAPNAGSERLTQTAAQDGEVAPEFGDAADPASEELGIHHRDE